MSDASATRSPGHGPPGRWTSGSAIAQWRCDRPRPSACPPAGGWRSTYLKLRRRGAFDFPVLGAAVALRRSNGTIVEARIALSGVGSRPLALPDAVARLAGQAPAEALFEEVAQIAYKKARALDNTDLVPLYRKRMVPVFVRRALEKLAES